MRSSSFSKLISLSVLSIAAVLASAQSHYCGWTCPHGDSGDSGDGRRSNFTTLNYKWEPGGNSSSYFETPPGTPGAASWSIMGPGLSFLWSYDPLHGLSQDFGTLIGGSTTVEEAAIIDAALNVWASVSGFTNLGQVADGNSMGGASNALNGHKGDIRIALTSGFDTGVLAHAYAPGTEDDDGPGGNIYGDAHFNSAYTWVDDPFDAPGGNDFDLFTVMLHEFGHSLGLGHTNVSGSIMQPVYAGAQRTLGADDIAGIQAIYGVNPVPEPASMAVLAGGAALLLRRRRSRV